MSPRDRDIDGQSVGNIDIEQSRQGAITQAIAALASSEQFALIFLRTEDADPEIVGFGVDPGIVRGLGIAHQYLLEEWGEQEDLFDVSQLVRLLCSDRVLT